MEKEKLKIPKKLLNESAAWLIRSISLEKSRIQLAIKMMEGDTRLRFLDSVCLPIFILLIFLSPLIVCMQRFCTIKHRLSDEMYLFIDMDLSLFSLPGSVNNSN